jgi:ribonuclease HII
LRKLKRLPTTPVRTSDCGLRFGSISGVNSAAWASTSPKPDIADIPRKSARHAVLASGGRSRDDAGMSRNAANPAAPRLPLGEDPIRPSFARERAALKRGIWPVAGCDEAGRGPLAGPVVAAAVILDPRRIPRGLDDSKKLTPERREILYERICARAEIGLAFGSRARIDRDNIRHAALWALARAVKALPTPPRLVFVDGCDRIEAGCDCEPVIRGDALVLSIAAASIIAKVARDRLMMQIGAAHPGYGFERHMGYAVPEHAQALSRLGPTVHHRRSFAPVARACASVPAAGREDTGFLLDAGRPAAAPGRRTER